MGFKLRRAGQIQLHLEEPIFQMSDSRSAECQKWKRFMNSCPEVKDAYEGVVAQVKDKKTPRTALAAFKKNFCVNQKYVFNETTARHFESYSRADHFTHEPKTFDQLVDIYKNSAVAQHVADWLVLQGLSSFSEMCGCTVYDHPEHRVVIKHSKSKSMTETGVRQPQVEREDEPFPAALCDGDVGIDDGETADEDGKTGKVADGMQDEEGGGKKKQIPAEEDVKKGKKGDSAAQEDGKKGKKGEENGAKEQQQENDAKKSKKRGKKSPTEEDAAEGQDMVEEQKPKDSALEKKGKKGVKETWERTQDELDAAVDVTNKGAKKNGTRRMVRWKPFPRRTRRTWTRECSRRTRTRARSRTRRTWTRARSRTNWCGSSCPWACQ